MNKDYISKCMQSKELNKMVKDSKTLPLIAELHHLYGVEVMRPLGLQITYDERNYEDKPPYYYEKIHNPNSSKWKDLEEQEQHDKEDNVTSKSELSKDCFMLGLNGVPYGAVYCTHSLTSDNLLFCIRLSKEVKERGTTDTDKRTLKSFKVAQIIKGIKKRDAIPLRYTPTRDNFTVLHEGLSKRDWEYQVDDVYRFNTKQMKAMFLNVIKKEPLSHEVSQELNKTSLMIDKVNNAIEQLDKSFTHNILESDIHLIGASNSDSLVVIKGAFKKMETWQEGMAPSLEYTFIIKDQEYVKTIEDSKYFDVLASTVVMMKMAMEDKSNIHGFIPFSKYRDSTLRKTLLENNGVNIIEQETYPHFTSIWLGIPNVGEVIV
jgi:hypothetical protein